MHMLQTGAERGVVPHGGRRSGTGLLQAMDTHIAGTALEQGDPHGKPQRAAHGGDVTPEQLVLKCLGGGGQ